MKSKTSWIIAAVIVSLIILSAIIYDTVQSRTSFKALVLDRIEEKKKSITSIELIKMDLGKPIETSLNERVTITDQPTIEAIIDRLSDVQLREDNYSPDSYYWIKIYTDNVDSFDIHISGQYMPRVHGNNMYDSDHKYNSRGYKILNTYDNSIIENLFQ